MLAGPRCAPRLHWTGASDVAESVFIVTELRQTGTGAIVDTPTVIRWTSTDRSSPRGVFEHGLAVTSHRSEVPGGDQPVEQVMSSSWQPFEVQGAWDDRHAGVGFAASAYRTIAELVARGPLVRMQVDTLSFTGVMTNLALRYQRASQIGWSLTFSPHRNETVTQPRAAFTSSRTSRITAPLTHHGAAVTASVDSMVEAHAAAAGMPAATELHTEAGVDLAAIQRMSNRVNDALASGFEEDALARLDTIGSLFRGVRGAAMALPARLGRARASATIAYDDVALTLLHEEWVRNVAADCRRAALRADRASSDVDAQSQARPLAIHRARQGESLARISQRYYGNQSGWRRIYVTNNLASLSLEGGQELIIPEASA